MAKIEVSMTYQNALVKFKDILASSLVDSNEFPNADSVAVDVSTGRKFDRIRVCHSKTVRNEETGVDTIETSPWDVRFFISRTNGAIYGKKSALAPNMKWYFGDVYTAHEWQWTGNSATPKDMSKYKMVSEYGPYKHYEKAS